MTKTSRSLSGTWRGQYAYQQGGGQTTPFLATIDDDGVYLKGETIEPDGRGGFGNRLASIAGHMDGSSVKFTKIYATAAAGYTDPINYVGSVSGEGSTITGVWTLLFGRGSFEMHREEGIAEEVAQETAIEVPQHRETVDAR